MTDEKRYNTNFTRGNQYISLLGYHINISHINNDI